MRPKTNLLSVLIFAMAVVAVSLSWAATVDDGFSVGHKIETRHFNVFIAPGVDDALLIRSLDIGPEHKILSGQSTAGVSYSANNLGDLLDVLFGWVCNVLDMKLYSYKGVIKIARDENELKGVFRKLYGQEGYSQKAFYVSELNTIYIAAPDFTKEILSHEMGHAIMGSYFVVQPPEKIAEVLAGYIEYQLRKSNTQP
ncbi:MAG: hypothetical protein HY209_03650 [Candidatus Omnitrophica bacterium]|nr:hypothetical protein [Candidatus Omnitrophota bacterium]